MHRVLITSAMVIVLAACGGSDQPAQPAATPSPAETTAPAAAPAVVRELPVEEIAALPAPYNETDYLNGERIYKQCSTCHLLPEGAGHRVGPNLHGFFGREAGALPDFNYSSAMQDADFIWTPELLDQWLTAPREFLPGNRMSFAGVRRPDERRDVIGYLLIETNK